MKPLKRTDRDKPWAKRTANKAPYRENSKEQAKVFLIICEGENTEPLYFKSFPLGNAKVECYGLGRSKTALVEHVVENVVYHSENAGKEIWVVFDFDIKPDQVEQQKEDYNGAIELAKKHNIKVAYSNDSFELWFLLHYQSLDVQWTRHHYYEKLSGYWDCNYENEAKRREFCRRIYQKLLDDPKSNQNAALSRAADLLSDQTEIAYADQNPCTTVFQLVAELNKSL
jgi:RloB-like protein